jgi:transposase
MRTIKEKKAIAKSHIIDRVSKNQLASTHNVAPSTIREWVRKYGASFDAREDIDEKKTVHKGGKVKNEAVNDQLKLFFEVLRDNGDVAVNYSTLATESLRLKNMQVVDNREFLIETRRVRRWAKFNGIVYRAGTRIAQNTRHNLEDANDWRQLIAETIAEYDIKDDCIINADQTPINFEIAAKKTLEKRGTKTVRIKTTGTTREREQLRCWQSQNLE